MSKRYLLLLICLLITFTLLVFLASPVIAQERSLTFAKPFTEEINYLQYEWETSFVNNLSYNIQLGYLSVKNYSFACNKFGFRYYPWAESIKGFYVGAYYNFFYFYHRFGYTPYEITTGPVSLALGAKLVFKNGLSIDMGCQAGDKYVSSGSELDSAMVPGYLVALGYSW